MCQLSGLEFGHEGLLLYWGLNVVLLGIDQKIDVFGKVEFLEDFVFY